MMNNQDLSTCKRTHFLEILGRSNYNAVKKKISEKDTSPGHNPWEANDPQSKNYKHGKQGWL